MRFGKAKSISVIKQVIAFGLVFVIVTVHLLSGVYAKYTSTGTGGGSATFATLGTATLNGTFSYTGLTPGVDITRTLTVARSAASSDVASYIVLVFQLNGWSYDSARNRFYISSGNFTNPHEVNAAAYPVYFDVDMTVKTHSWERVGIVPAISAPNYVFYVRPVDAGTAGTLNSTHYQTNVINNSKIYVSAEINTDDIAYLSSVVNQISVTAYVVSRYGYTSTTALCADLYTNIISAS